MTLSETAAAIAAGVLVTAALGAAIGAASDIAIQEEKRVVFHEIAPFSWSEVLTSAGIGFATAGLVRGAGAGMGAVAGEAAAGGAGAGMGAGAGEVASDGSNIAQRLAVGAAEAPSTVSPVEAGTPVWRYWGYNEEPDGGLAVIDGKVGPNGESLPSGARPWGQSWTTVDPAH